LNSIDYGDESCPLCLESIENAVMIASCGHFFCKSCLSDGFYGSFSSSSSSSGSSCPVCKRSYSTNLSLLDIPKDSNDGGVDSTLGKFLQPKVSLPEKTDNSLNFHPSIVSNSLPLDLSQNANSTTTTSETLSWQSSSKIDALMKELLSTDDHLDDDDDGDDDDDNDDNDNDDQYEKQENLVVEDSVDDLVLDKTIDSSLESNVVEHGSDIDMPVDNGERRKHRKASSSYENISRENRKYGDLEIRKSVVFSQWRSMLSLVEVALQRACIRYTRLDGTMSSTQRDQAVSVFTKDSQVRVLLISTKAGGFGLNLIAASRVFLLDPWWNPATEDQAIDRVHRLGQQSSVRVIRFIVRGSIEERMLELQKRKKLLARGALADGSVNWRQIRLEELRLLFQD